VLIQKSHRGWLLFFLITVALSYALYRYELHRGPAAVFGPSGGSAIGLTFGIAAAALLLFAGLRGVRRRLPGANPGASRTWDRAHLWLGALILPLAWFHGAFHHGGALTSASMWLLYIVTVSGIVAAMLRSLVAPAPSDDPVDAAIARLALEAEDAVALCGPMNGGDVEQWRAERKRSIESRVELAGGAHPRDTLLAAVAAAPAARSEPLKELYAQSVQRYLAGDDAESVLTDRVRAGQVLRRYRTLLPDELQGTVTRLEQICDDCRSLRALARMRQRIDAWMVVHLPLSLALIILVALHAIYALRY
jgi:hypothetical protein